MLMVILLYNTYYCINYIIIENLMKNCNKWFISFSCMVPSFLGFLQLDLQVRFYLFLAVPIIYTILVSLSVYLFYYTLYIIFSLYICSLKISRICINMLTSSTTLEMTFPKLFNKAHLTYICIVFVYYYVCKNIVQNCRLVI